MPEKTILLVEDEKALCSLLADQLADAGYRVLKSTGGEDAAANLAREPVHLMLTDLLMPGKDGIELIQLARKSHPELPVIAMSGGGEVHAGFYLKMARSLGARAILEKPFTTEEMLRLVAVTLDGTTSDQD
ncbi:transcriptional regulatory protein CssR [mine drainage metagenome]|uniref:Transcriptional regulatory protein CssR n=1 Tax=mine drainage metagenome TaxID=410659 RepID=A0A1J5SJM7_9ZZZZ